MDDIKILIVEDEALIAEELSETLTDLGYKVSGIVNSGTKALVKINTDKPDLVIMDIRIKGEMDGIEVAEKIDKKTGPPVIFLSAFLNDEFMNRAKTTEPFGYLIKPVNSRELHSTIEIALYKAKMEKERNELIAELKRTQEELKKVRTFIPICSGCKKIRTDEGYWEAVESYVAEHFSATFSHGICPDCVKRLYSDLVEDK